jgi:hypothetical protein
MQRAAHVADRLHETAAFRDSPETRCAIQNRPLKEEHVVTEEGNSVDAFRHFFGPAYPGLRQMVRLVLRHPVSSGLIVLMNLLGLLAYLLTW